MTGAAHRRRQVRLAAASAALSLVAAGCAGCSGVDGVSGTETLGGATGVTLTPGPAGPTADDPQVALERLLRWVSSAKAELAQYQLDLHGACGSGSPRQCRDALRYSATVGANVADDLSQVGSRPPHVTELWRRTWSAAVALTTVAERWCGPQRGLEGCSGAVGRALAHLNQELAGWDPYRAGG